MKNYIEVENKYTDEDGAVNVDVYCAVRPTPSRVELEDHRTLDFLSPWVLFPDEDVVRVYGREEIDGIRKLLDAVEAEMEAEEK